MHVSGHPNRDDLKDMYKWVKPKCVIPVHGEHRHMMEHINFAKEMLTCLDNLQRAKKSIQENEAFKKSNEFESFLKNIEIIEKDLISTFEKNKITKINCLNKMFDPNFHQAMLEIEDNNVKPGTIIQEIQTGFMFGERLLRPSFVGISKKKEEKNEKNK